MRNNVIQRILFVFLFFVHFCIPANTEGQTFDFHTREISTRKTGSSFKTLQAPFTDSVYNSFDWSGMSNSTWNSNNQFKSVRGFVKFYVDHHYKIKVNNPYIYKVCFEVKGYAGPLASSTTIFNDTLVIAYNPDSLTAYQDFQAKSYTGFQKLVVRITGFYDITNPSAPVAINLADPNFTNRNFQIEYSLLVQKYEKQYYGSGTVPVIQASVNNDRLDITIKGPGGIDPPVPTNYELEWAYVDNYGSGPFKYDFKNNSTRVWLNKNVYSIPLSYQQGYIVYRARFVRPDVTNYRYPVYSDWSLSADQGTVTSLSSVHYKTLTPHLQDKMNWQYTVSFAEEGKYKQVMSYYDGLLKNRQTITRFNSLPGKLIVTDNTLDYEGRPSIKTLPAPVPSNLFKYQTNVSLNAVTGQPYQPSDFDKLSTYSCPNEVMPDKLGNTALSNIYYSKYNTDTAGWQKYVPDADGYPFIQTRYSAGYNDRIDKQGGAGDSLQIGTKHYTTYNYVGSDQSDLNQLMGADIGWAGFYNKTVTEDPNGQLSMSVKDYKGKLVHTSMIGNVDFTTKSFVSTPMAPNPAYFENDLIANNPQQVVGNQRILDHNFFMDFGAVDSFQYIYNFLPYPTFCPNKYLSVAASYWYRMFDDCGVEKYYESDTLGINGVVDSMVRSYPGIKKDTFLDQGKYSVHKELTVDMNNVYAAVDSFMILPDNCLRNVHDFIKEEVLERSFPCPADDYPDDPCAIKKKQMMDDLKPGGKYGKYHIATIVGVDHITGPGYYHLNGSNPQNNHSVFDRDEDMHYRFQDTCIVTLPASLSKNGVSYSRSQYMASADLFLYLYSGSNADLIAEALLPLHPEYCRSQLCFIDSFKEMYAAIPDAKTAEARGLLYLDSIIKKDPILPMLSSQLGFPSPYDSLRSFRGGKVYFDTLITTLAYCNCTDTIMFQNCTNDVFKTEIQSLVLTNDYVKEKYFKNMTQIYFQNRERYKNYQIAGATDSCGPCKNQRIALEPPPIYTTYFTATGQIDTSSPSSFWSLFLNDTSSTNLGSYDLQQVLNMAANMSEDSIQMYNDTAHQIYNHMDSLLCVEQMDSITARLVNCFAGGSVITVKNYLNNLVQTGQVHYGNYTPMQIRDAIVAAGLSLSDLCNPYLVNYTDFDFTSTSDLNCKQQSYYYSLKGFLNNVVQTGVLDNQSTGTVILQSGYDFDDLLISRFGTSSVNVKGSYNSYGGLYTIKIYKNTNDTLKLYMRGSGSGSTQACTSIFSGQGTDAITVTDVRCILDLGGIGDGYISEYSFVANVSRTTLAQATTSCTLLGWTNSMEMSNLSVDKLAECVPCTEMKERYKEFTDTLLSYGVKGVDHPYYDQMLRSFLNYKTGKRFTTEQYERFIESCQLADSMYIKRYNGYATFTFSSDQNAKAFISYMNAISVGITIDNPYWEQSNSGSYTLMVNLNNIPYNKLYIYKNALNSYNGSYTAKWINKPFAEIIPGRIGFIYTDTIAHFVPVWAQILGPSLTTPNSPIYYDTANIQGPLPVKYKIGSQYAMQDVYLINSNNASPVVVSQVTDKISTYLIAQGLPSNFVDHYMSTVDENYYRPEKQALLQYQYNLRAQSSGNVLDSMHEENLNAEVYTPLSTSGTYTTPMHPGNTTDLYIVSSQSSPYFRRVDTMLRNIAAVNGGRITMQIGTNTKSGAGSFTNLKAYHCSDNSYYYQYFATGDTLFNLFFRLPKYLHKNEHFDYLPLFNTLTVLPGDGVSRNFSIKLAGTKLNALNKYDTLVIKGLTDFSLGQNLVLRDVLLGNPIDVTSPAADTFDHCERTRLTDAIYEGKWRYAMYIDSVREFLANDFYAYVMNGIYEQLNVGYWDQRFQKTLYYYDRAGNLIKTVPPAGVTMLSNNLIKKVDTVRTNNTVQANLYPSHTKTSVYKYDSRNQLTEQTTPDGGTVKFWYDAAGRLVFSQNDKQNATGRYTYNLYDDQSRIMETGQCALGCPGYGEYSVTDTLHFIGGCRYIYPQPLGFLVSPVPPMVYNCLTTPHSQVITAIRQHLREDVVLTVYDTAVGNLAAIPGMSSQENLRKRVTAVKYFTTLGSGNNAFSGYSHCVYYSYDIGGNVKTLTHDFPKLESYNQRYKRIDYDYDVISGKVNLLSYNRGFSDQYYQRYSYDDDNRITKVETSADGFKWLRDAEYNYYQHGPLARLSLGDLRVQGVDYAYTVQGWLKAINSDIMTTQADMGKDANSKDSIHANDAVALTLDYFAGDYKPIGVDSFIYMQHTGKNLYNGNISRQMVGILPFDRLNTTYTFDQLHRIKQTGYDVIDPVNKTLSAIDDYKSNYQYDQDGNITKLVRWGNNPSTNTIAGAAQLMDSMNYYYANSKPNQLTNVTDLSTSTAFPEEIQPYTTASSARFLYDPVGNMIKDQMNNQDTIVWNLYNKVVKTNNTTAKNNLVFMYDGAGNRTAKIFTQQTDTVYQDNGDYYVRDAQGNILAVYKTEDKYQMKTYTLIHEIADVIDDAPGGRIRWIDTVLAPWRDGWFTATVLDKIGRNTPTWVGAKLNSYDVSFYLNAGKKQAMLEGTYAYVNPLLSYNRENEKSIIENAWKDMFEKQDDKMIKDWTASLLLDDQDDRKQAILSNFCSMDNGLAMINVLRQSIGLEEEPENCTAAINGLAHGINNENIENISFGFKTMYQEPAYADNLATLFHNISYSEDIANNEYYTAPDALYSVALRKALSAYTEGETEGQLYSFFDEWSGAREQLNNISTTAELNSMVYNSNPSGYLSQYTADNDYYSLDTTLADHPHFSLDKLLIRANAADPATQPDITLLVQTYQVFINRRMWLAEHHLYGSSRLGIKHYWRDQLYNNWDYTQNPSQPVVDTGRLQSRQPWYSAEYDDAVNYSAVTPYGNAQAAPFSLQHTLGTKGYELTNHLGNVLAVVIDKRQNIDLNSDDTIDRYRPSLMAAYDYYPFGSLMPGRYVNDTSTQCAWISQTRYVPQWTYVPIWINWDCPIASCGFQPWSGGNIAIQGSGPEALLRVGGGSAGRGAWNTLDVTPNTEEDITIPVSSLNATFTLYVERHIGSEWQAATTRTLDAAGDVQITFATGQASEVRFRVVAASGSGVIFFYPWRRWKLTYSQQNVLVKVCNKAEDKYRFGFNGQEKDNEIKGVGNSLDFTERIYDSRLGRFLSLDPLMAKFPYQSPYIFAKNNPIYFVDEKGKSGVAYKTDKVNADCKPIIKVVTNVYIYGEGATTEMAKSIQTDAMSNWNNDNKYFNVNIDNTDFEVQFEINVSVVDIKDVDASLVEGGYGNLNAENNFYEIRSDVNSSITLTGDNGGNAGVLQLSEIGKQSPNHELNHGYDGEDKDNKNTDKGSDNDIAVQSKNSKSPKTRKVTQGNIDAIFKNVNFKGGNKANVGSARPFLYDNSNKTQQSKQIPDPDKQ